MGYSLNIDEVSSGRKLVMKFNEIPKKNRRQPEWIALGKAWSMYAKEVSTNRFVRNLINEEQNQFAEFVFTELTRPNPDRDEFFNEISMKKFISNVIDYIYDCEKESWTVYLIICLFKMLGNILKLWDDEINNKEIIDDIKIAKIGQNILEIVDTLRNSDMIFEILSQSKEDDKFSTEIFCITMYFLNKLMHLRIQSLQKKFKGLFLNDPACPAFFKKVNTYLKSHSDKRRSGLLKQFYFKQRYTDELSPKAYFVDK
jgi:hypothetical protein